MFHSRACIVSPGRWRIGNVTEAGDSTSAGPIWVFNNQLFAFWKANDPSNRLFVSQSPSGAADSFSTRQGINTIDSTSATPEAAVCKPGLLALEGQ
jgi:hypothetical protein